MCKEYPTVIKIKNPILAPDNVLIDHSPVKSGRLENSKVAMTHLLVGAAMLQRQPLYRLIYIIF